MKTTNNSHDRNRSVTRASRLESPRALPGAGEPALEASLRVAYDLAKSAGHELELIFSSEGNHESSLGRPPLPLRVAAEGLVVSILVRGYGLAGLDTHLLGRASG